MKYRKMQIAAVLLVGALLSVTSACGNNPDANESMVCLEQSADESTCLVGYEIKLTTNYTKEPYRFVEWVTISTQQRTQNPYLADGNMDADMVGNVEIAITALASNVAFDGPLSPDSQYDPALVPIVLIDNHGNEHMSPFITKTDDTGRYILGLNILTWACRTFKSDVQIRLADSMAQVDVSVGTELSGAQLAALCETE